MVDCPYCGFSIYGAMTAKCPQCGKPVDVRELHKKAEENRQKQRREDPKLLKNFSSFIKALENGKAGVVIGQQVVGGENGWAYFVCEMLDKRPYTAMQCSSCGYLLIRDFTPGDNWITRGNGSASALNWMAWFKCIQCGTDHHASPVTVSYDSHAYGLKTFEPIGAIYYTKQEHQKSSNNPWWKFW